MAHNKWRLKFSNDRGDIVILLLLSLFFYLTHLKPFFVFVLCAVCMETQLEYSNADIRQKAAMGMQMTKTKCVASIRLTRFCNPKNSPISDNNKKKSSWFAWILFFKALTHWIHSDISVVLMTWKNKINFYNLTFYFCWTSLHSTHACINLRSPRLF